MSLLEDLKAKLGPSVSSDADHLSLVSRDLSSMGDHDVAVASVAVQSAEDVQTVLESVARHKAQVSVRAGGMSYTGGFRPKNDNTVIVDITPMNRVVEVSTANQFMVVEAGCTWAQVSDSLQSTGHRTVLRGPISGVISTVGGAVSQNLPGSMDGVLGLEVVTGAGDILRTGSLAAHDGLGFYRNYGPDLTGLFLGDNGSFGIKTRIALRLEPIPQGLSHTSFAFDSMGQIAGAMVAISQNRLAARMFGLDPLKNKTATKVDTREGLSTLKEVATKSSKGLMSGLKDAAKIAAAGRSAMDHVEWSLHVSTEGQDQTVADQKMARVNEICADATSIEPSIPVAMAAKPFSVRGMLGLQGERWLPLHGLFPYERVQEAVEKTQAFFSEHRPALEAHGIIHSFMLSAGDGFYLIEPMFYWPDALIPLHRAALGADRVKKFEGQAENTAAQQLVATLRAELRDIYFSMGALSAQNGAFYRFADALDAQTLNTLRQIKSQFDPHSLLNAPAIDQ